MRPHSKLGAEPNSKEQVLLNPPIPPSLLGHIPEFLNHVGGEIQGLHI